MQPVRRLFSFSALARAGRLAGSSPKPSASRIAISMAIAFLLLAFSTGLSAQTTLINLLMLSPQDQPTYNEALTATVFVRDENSLQPLTGTVNYAVDGGRAIAATIGSDGVAYANLGRLSIGSHMVTATFAGNATYSSASTSTTVSIGDVPLSFVGTQGTTLFADGVVSDVEGVAVDAQDDLYISDKSNGKIFKEDTLGNVTTIPVTGLKAPIGLALDSAGNLYIADTGNNRIVELSASGTQTTVPTAALSGPTYLAYDRLNDLLYIVDPGNSRIESYTPATKKSADVVTGMTALRGVAVDAAGNVFYSDKNAGFMELSAFGLQFPIYAAVQEIGGITAGAGSYLILTDTATNAVLRYNNSPETIVQGHQVQINNAENPVVGVAADSTGRVYLALGGRVDVLDTGSGRAPDTGVNPPSGSINSDFSLIFQTPQAKPAFTVTASPAATFNHLSSDGCPGNTGLCVESANFVPQVAGLNSGSISVTEAYDLGDIPLWGKGIGGAAAFTPGSISQSSPQASSIGGVAFDLAGNRYVTDPQANAVKKITPSGTVSTLKFTGLSGPTQIAVDALGAVYVLDAGNQRIVRLAADGLQSVAYESGGEGSPFTTLTAFTLDGDSNLVIAGLAQNSPPEKKSRRPIANADQSGEFIIAVIGHSFPADGKKVDLSIPYESTRDFTSGMAEVTGIAVDLEGNVYSVDTSGSLWRFGVDGSAKQLDTGLSSPVGVVLDASGTVYVLGGNPHPITILYPDGTKSSITVNGLYTPTAFALDAYGDILLGDGGDKQILYLDRTQQNYVFGDVNVGSSENVNGSIGNIGNQPFTIASALPANGTFAQIAADDECVAAASGGVAATTVAPFGSCNLSYTFTPPSAGPFTLSGVLGTTPQTLVGSGGGGTIKLTGTGEGNANPAPNPVLTPATIDFGSLTVGATSAAKMATLTNSGTASLTISSFGFFGTDTKSFSETSTCGASLAAGGTCSISISCTPANAGVLTANLGANFPSPIPQQSIALTCTGATSASPQAALTPKTASFTAVEGSTSAAQTFTLTNGGSAALTITSIGLGGANASEFAISAKTCGTSLAAGSSCTVAITYSPGTTSSGSATLTVADNASGSPQTSALSGTGTATAAPAATLTPAKLDFGSVNSGTSTAAQNATLTNTGNAPLTITGVSLTGTNIAAFTLKNNCSASLAAGASCLIAVAFDPTTTGADSATLMVSDNATGSPQTSALTGTGTTVAPAADFGLSATPANQTVTSGSSAAYQVTVSSLNGSFTNAVALTASGLPPGSTVVFSPASVVPGTSSAASTMTIQTATQQAALSGHSPRWHVPVALVSAALLLLPFRRRRKLLSSLGCFILLTILGGTLSACGGGFALPQSNPTTYTVTVTGTSGSLQHSTSVQIAVR